MSKDTSDEFDMVLLGLVAINVLAGIIILIGYILETTYGKFIIYNISGWITVHYGIKFLKQYGDNLKIKRYDNKINRYLPELLSIAGEYKQLSLKDEVIKANGLRNSFITRIYMTAGGLPVIGLSDKIEQLKIAKIEFVYPMMENIIESLVHDRDDIDVNKLINIIGITDRFIELTLAKRMKWTLHSAEGDFRYIASDIADNSKFCKVNQSNDVVTLIMPNVEIQYDPWLKPYGKKLIDVIIGKNINCTN